MIGLTENQFVLLFYGSIIALVFLNRKRFDMQGIIALYRTKIGLKSMESISRKYREIVKLLGFIGIGASYIGLMVISYVLVKNFFDLLISPTAASAVTPVIPGVSIPGSDFKIPLISGWLALFVVILIHEFSHGVVARAHNLKVKSSGIFFMGPLMGAFVEPDEKELKSASDVTQYSILAAGPFSNMLLAGFIILLFIFIVPPIQSSLVLDDGFLIHSVEDKLPAHNAGLQPGLVITNVNTQKVSNRDEFISSLKYIAPGKEFNITANHTQYKVIPTINPENNQTAYIGVSGNTNQSPKNEASKAIMPLYAWIVGFLSLIGALSLGIGLINLFPIFITDGARMLYVSLLKISKDSGLKIWKHTNLICLLILFLSLFFPLFRWLFKVL